MFCYKCGAKIVDDSTFCSNCGIAQKGQDTSITKKSQSDSNELQRDALKIYLANVLTLECIKMKLDEDCYEAERKLDYEDNNNYVKCYPISNGYVWLAYHADMFHIGAFRDGAYGGAYTGKFLNREEMMEGNGFVEYVWGEGIIKHRGEFYWGRIDESSLEEIKRPAFWWDIGGDGFLQEKMRQVGARNAFLRVYEEFKQTAPTVYKNNYERTVRPLQDKVEGIKEEYRRADELLQSAYSANIIPAQFRNIHAVWYIHDFITTSNESLATALLQCNLDEIKQKLDTIIEQNNRIIIQNAVMISQNSQIIKQNQDMLGKFKDMEDNIERASQYAQIAANNAEICAYISCANYLKD